MGVCLPYKIYSHDWLPSDSLFFSSLRLDIPDMLNVRNSVEKGDYSAAKVLLLQYKRLAGGGKWFMEPFVAERLSDETDIAADSVCMHYIYDDINLKRPYVEGRVYMGEHFDWLFNPRESGDPNYTVEWTYSCVSRINFLNKLVVAYKKTGNEKYLEKWRWFMYDFAKDNPLTVKPIWRTLDTAIRIRTWLNTYLTFRNSARFTAEDNTLYLKLIYEHAEHLKNTLLRDFERTGNHVTTECAALFTMGCVFQEFAKAEEWRTVAMNRYVDEIKKVVPPDGLQAELSPSYHYGVVATYKQLYDIAKINDIRLPESFTSRLLDMYRAPVLLMDQWGDHVRTNDSSLKKIKEISKEGLKIGYDPVLAWVVSDGKEGEELPSTTFLNYAGFYMMRSGWRDNGMFLFFRGGPQGIGHVEQEKLQIVLKAWGKTLLFDPGKYPYDQSDWRRFSINTPSHNTIIVDGKWQYRKKVIPEKFSPVDNLFCTTPLFDYVSSSYTDGYVTNVYNPKKSYQPQIWMNDRDTTVTHTRNVLYLKPYYALIIDQLEGSGEHVFDAHFHLDAPTAALNSDGHYVHSVRNDSVQIGIYAIDKENLQTEIIQGQDTPLLGWYPIEHRAIPTVRFRKKQETPASFATFLYPYKNVSPMFSTENIDVRSEYMIWGQRIFTDEETAEVVLDKRNNLSAFSFQSVLIGNLDIVGKGVVIRQSKVYADLVSVGIWGASDYQDKMFAFRFPDLTDVVLQQNGDSIIAFNAGEKESRMLIRKPFKKEVILEPGEWVVISEAKEEKNVQPLMFPLFNERK